MAHWVEEGVCLWISALACISSLHLGSGLQVWALSTKVCSLLAAILLLPFLHHPGQHFCAFIDQFGLTMIRQGVGFAVNLYHGELRMGPGCIPGHLLLQCSHSSAWTPPVMRNFGGQSDILRNVFLMLSHIYQEELNPFAYSYYLTSYRTTQFSSQPGSLSSESRVHVNMRCTELMPVPQKFLPSFFISKIL